VLGIPQTMLQMWTPVSTVVLLILVPLVLLLLLLLHLQVAAAPWCGAER
jgi:hypothetical protein